MKKNTPGRTRSVLFALTLLLFANASLSYGQTRWDDGNDRSRAQTFDSSGSLWQGSNWLGGTQTQATDWQLGVEGENAPVGVLVRSVIPNSAADRARIEPGDVILNIGGFQIGMVDGRFYDLPDEINRRASSSGVVSMVVQDHRTNRLAQVQVQLDNGSKQALRGELVYRGRTPIPSDAIVTVMITNLTRPYFQVRNGRTAFTATRGETTFPFEIAFDPTYINEQDSYQVSAFVTSRGRTILDTPRPQQVITRGNPLQVRLQLDALNNGQSQGGGLASTGGTGVVTAGYPNYNQIDDRIIALYERYLGRQPQFLELAALRATPGIADRLDNLHLELMAAQEYFDAKGNNNRVWLENVFQEIIRRPATPTELDRWMVRYQSLRFSRTELLRQLVSVAPR